MVGTQMDVSDRKAAELSLQEQEGSFRSLFELSPAGICLTEFPAGRFLKVNDALVAMLGYSREALLRLTYMDITPEEFRDADRAQVSLIQRNTRFGPYEKAFLDKNGRRVGVTLSGVRMKDASGRDVVWAGPGEDARGMGGGSSSVCGRSQSDRLSFSSPNSR
jgi:PAS domain S-box-containing protein